MMHNALKVLVVEPERAIASSLCAALDRRGHRALLVAEASDALEHEAPDVLICGVGPDDEDRYELLEEYGRRGSQPAESSRSPAPNDARYRSVRP